MDKYIVISFILAYTISQKGAGKLPYSLPSASLSQV